MAANDYKNRPSNYVILTLQAITAGESQFAGSGKPWAKVRAFLSQGKDKASGEYRPSIFFDVKAFSEDENMSAPVAAISQVANKSRFTVKGRLGMEEWTGQDGATHQKLVVFANSVEPFHFANEADAQPAEELEGEPA